MSEGCLLGLCSVKHLRQHLRHRQRHQQQQQIPRHNYKLWQRKLQEAPEQRRLPRGVEQSLELQVGWRVS
jgi:hypothetical protein